MFDGLGYKGNRLTFVNGKLISFGHLKQSPINKNDIEFQMIKRTHISKYSKFAGVEYKYSVLYESEGIKMYFMPLKGVEGTPEVGHYYVKYGDGKFFEWNNDIPDSDHREDCSIFGAGKVFKESNLTFVSKCSNSLVRIVNLFDNKTELVHFSYDF